MRATKGNPTDADSKLSIGEIAHRLGGAKKIAGGWVCRCPVHDDQHASLSLSEGRNGKILAHCHTGCSQESVVDELKRRGFWPETRRPNGAGCHADRRTETLYDYTDEQGELLFQTVRFVPKGFAQRRPDGKGEWVWNLGDCRRVLYHLPEVIEAAGRGGLVVICEGEKDADNLRAMGFCATTSPMGAGKWRAEYAEFLRGASVAILPDNDAPGIKHATAIRKSLQGSACVVTLSGLPEKGGDVSDWVAAGGTAERLHDLIAGAQKAPEARDDCDDERPLIRLSAGEITRIVDQIEDAVLTADVGLYQRNGNAARVETAVIPMPDAPPRPTLVIRDQEAGALREDVCKAARFEKFDKRAEKWFGCDPPTAYIRDWLARHERMKLPPLTGTISSPLILPQARRIISAPGYDAGSGLFFMPLGASFPVVPTNPSRDDALKALTLLRSLLAEFPFADGHRGASEAVMLSAIISAIMRAALGNVPLHAFNAPASRTGKSLAATLVSMISQGRAPALCTTGKNEDELEKRIDAMLLWSPPFFLIDNLTFPLESAALCVLLTQEEKRIRPLCTSDFPEITSRPFVELTGNNLALVGDLAGRTIRCTIDAKCERPEFRPIRRRSLLQDVKKDRGRYAVAALTIVQAFLCANAPAQTEPLGSFEKWSLYVRDALIWLDCADACDTMEAIRADDPKRSDFAHVMKLWWGIFKSEPFTVREVISTAALQYNGELVHPDLNDAMMQIAGTRGQIDGVRLSGWLRRHKRTVADGKYFDRTEGHDGHGFARWVVSEVS